MGVSSSHGAGDRSARPRQFGLGKINFFLLAAGVVAVFFGYVLLDRGSVTAAPLLLVGGYAVLIPAGLLWGIRGRELPGEDGDRSSGE